MSASTVPAAVPEPNSTPGTITPASPATGLIASMLAPVDPARATFSLDPQATANGTTGTASEASAEASAEGSSSVSYHGTEDTHQGGVGGTGSGGGSGKAKQGIWRAWLLAGAARWARGGGTQNKRLDVKKARAMAHQVKETRQAPVNKPGGPGAAGGGRSAGSSGSPAVGPGGKSLGSKGGKGDAAAKGPKNSPTGTGAGSAGRSGGTGSGASGGGGRGSSGASPNGAKSGGAPKGKQDNPGRTPKAPKGDVPTSPKGGTGGGTAGGKSGTPGSAGKPGKDGGRAHTDSKGPGSAGSADGKGDKSLVAKAPTTKPAPAKDSKDGATPKDGAGRQPDGSSAKGPTTKAVTAPDGAAGKGDTSSAGPAGKGIKHSLIKKTKKPEPAPAKADDQPKPDQNKDQHPTKLDPKAGPQVEDKPKADPKTDQDTGKGKPFTTKSSRETGYRDGTRAAKATGHVRAYRDGLKDGWVDTTEAAGREKARLDQAHQDRKQDRTKEQPVTTPAASSADYHQPQPVEVTGIDSKDLQLGDGAARDWVTRGEVRTLKGFERRLETKTSNMTQVADDTKGLKAHAEQQAKGAIRLMEAAKSVKGGDKLTGALAKLADAATVQSNKAGEIHKRAVRAAEACPVVLTNVETRYGPMYQAVVDSDETVPAELAFYKG